MRRQNNELTKSQVILALATRVDHCYSIAEIAEIANTTNKSVSSVIAKAWKKDQTLKFTYSSNTINRGNAVHFNSVDDLFKMLDASKKKATK